MLLTALLQLWLKFRAGIDKYWIVPVRKLFYFHHCFQDISLGYYGDFWVCCLNPHSIRKKALQQLVLMTNMYMSEKGFSYLVVLMGVGRCGQEDLRF